MNDELQEAFSRAARKLKRIIKREGDASGERLKPYYLHQLILEELAQMDAERLLGCV